MVDLRRDTRFSLEDDWMMQAERFVKDGYIVITVFDHDATIAGWRIFNSDGSNRLRLSKPEVENSMLPSQHNQC